MNKTQLYKFEVIGILLIVLAVIFAIGYGCGRKSEKDRVPAVITKHDTIIERHTDTFCIVKDSVIVRTKKVPVEVYNEVTKDSIVHDTIFIDLPITQKHYALENTYDAWVSGYDVALDSIYTYNRKITETITINEKQRRFGVGVQVGYGLTIWKEPVLRPYVGVGVYYRIW